MSFTSVTVVVVCTRLNFLRYLSAVLLVYIVVLLSGLTFGCREGLWEGCLGLGLANCVAYITGFYQFIVFISWFYHFTVVLVKW